MSEVEMFANKLNNVLREEQKKYQDRVLSGEYENHAGYLEDVTIYKTLGHARSVLGETYGKFFEQDNDEGGSQMQQATDGEET